MLLLPIELEIVFLFHYNSILFFNNLLLLLLSFLILILLLLFNKYKKILYNINIQKKKNKKIR
jgi:hypothetical protein